MLNRVEPFCGSIGRASTSFPSPAGIDANHREKADTRELGMGNLIVGLILGIALVDFLAQNTHSVRIEFFWASGQVPIVVALLVAALAGAAIVLIVGGARIGQLRHRLRHPAVATRSNAAAPVDPAQPPTDQTAAG